MPKAFSGAGAAVVDGRLIVVGGEGTSSAFATVQAYDLTTTNWSTSLPALPEGRHGLAVAAIGTTLYAINGAAQAGHHGSTNTVEALIVPRDPLNPPGVGRRGRRRRCRSRWGCGGERPDLGGWWADRRVPGHREDGVLRPDARCVGSGSAAAVRGAPRDDGGVPEAGGGDRRVRVARHRCVWPTPPIGC